MVCTDKQSCGAAKSDGLSRCLDICSNEFVDVPSCVANSKCIPSTTIKHEHECQCDNGFERLHFENGTQRCLESCKNDQDCVSGEVCSAVKGEARKTSKI